MLDNQVVVANLPQFYGLKIIKKKELTKNTFELELDVPQELQNLFQFQAGQYVSLKFVAHQKEVTNDYSITSAPYENKLTLGIKIPSEQSNTLQLFRNYNVGDWIQTTTPNGRFYIASKPNEKRTIIGFAAGIGITPIFSHIKNILETEKSTRFYLFYSNKTRKDIIYFEALEDLKTQFPERFYVYYFFSQEKIKDLLFSGRLDHKKISLIINQILHLDDDDEESTIWDSTDKILICGPGEMIKTVANACYNHGILKKNIHFELFQAYNDDIYPQEKELPLFENITITYKYNNIIKEGIVLENNKRKILQQLLDLGYNLPYSCKSGVCGSCICKLKKGLVDMEENEYLTDNELKQQKILPCSAIALSKDLYLDFDNL